MVLSQVPLKYISSGQLLMGQRLPSSRKWAEKLLVNRSKVSKAYEELELQGWIRSKVGSGHYIGNILHTEPLHTGMDDNAPRGSGNQILSSKKFPDISKLSTPPIVTGSGFSLGDDLTDPKLSFLKEFYQAYRSQLNRGGYCYRYGRYGDPKGSDSFRAVLANFLNDNRGLQISPDHIISSNGTVMAMNLIGHVTFPIFGAASRRVLKHENSCYR